MQKGGLQLENDADGERESPGDYSVWDILMKIKAGTTRVYQSILHGREGKYVGFYSSIDVYAKKMALEIGEDIWSWLKICLIEQGWAMDCITKLVHISFTPEAANNASLVRCDKQTQMVISGAKIKR